MTNKKDNALSEKITPLTYWWREIKEAVIEEIRAEDPVEGEEGLSLQARNICSKLINSWFEDKVYDNSIPMPPEYVLKSTADKEKQEWWASKQMNEETLEPIREVIKQENQEGQRGSMQVNRWKLIDAIKETLERADK